MVHRNQFHMSSKQIWKTKADQKIPRFLFGRIKWLLSQNQAKLPETLKKKNQQTRKNQISEELQNAGE